MHLVLQQTPLMRRIRGLQLHKWFENALLEVMIGLSIDIFGTHYRHNVVGKVLCNFEARYLAFERYAGLVQHAFNAWI